MTDAYIPFSNKQKIARLIEVEGVEVLIRLQKPLEEPPESVKVTFEMKDGVPTLNYDDSWQEFGTCVIVESWSEATGTVITQGIRKALDQSDEQFSFSARYLLNSGTDEQWVEILKARKVDKVIKMTCGPVPSFVEPTVKKEKK